MTKATRVWALAITGLAGCASLRAGANPQCRPVEGTLSSRASAATMRGDFVLTMAASGGGNAGQSVSGRLSLSVQDSAVLASGGAMQLLIGTADIALEAVGAVRMGDLTGADGRGPGVAVYESRPADGAPTVVVRLGSASNARGPEAFDAGHTTLNVRQISARGFAGGWSSGAGSTFPLRQSQGFFCAVRVEGS